MRTAALHSLSLTRRDHMAERETFNPSRVPPDRTRVADVELSNSLALLAVCIVLTVFVIICLRKHHK